MRSSHLLCELLLLAACATPTQAAPRAAAAPDANTIDVGGRTRNFALHMPAKLPAGRVPLVIVLHGGGGRSDMVETRLGFDELGDREGFAVVYPEGLNHHWNDSRQGNDAVDTDDVGFIRALIDQLVATHPIDAKRVFVTGMSNGGIMTYRLGCELADRIVAIAPVSGNVPAPIGATCHPSRPLSLLAINGTDDPLVPYAGGTVGFVRKSRGDVLGAAASTQLFARAAGCMGEPTQTQEPDRDADDGTTVSHYDYPGCPAGITIELVAIAGGGHSWPGPNMKARKLTGRVSREFSATERIWRFFADHGGVTR